MLNTLIDFLTFAILFYVLSLNTEIAQIISYLAGTVNSYVWNKCWTFQSNKQSSGNWLEMIRFILISLTALLFSLLILIVLENAHVWVWTSKGIATMTGMAVNFLGMKIWVFSTDEECKYEKS
ncbi:GtrA family protein [Hazenella sp. IB182357]|uniref:GtrA family protein n=1 Tax=Polycladospora coralii TaxID=2771432 RepID=A0A926NB52_9BACL|nr:GtrA family protein [Polycladospora coralii]MBS7528898.1 GtrA family protein [Polycladospora coralii]